MNVPTLPSTTQIVVHQDNSPLPTGIVLDETNYSFSSQLMEMQISARNKVGYLTGSTEKPDPTDPKLDTWVIENNRVKIWLIDSTCPALIQLFIKIPMTREIWEAVARTFYDGSNETHIF